MCGKYIVSFYISNHLANMGNCCSDPASLERPKLNQASKSDFPPVPVHVPIPKITYQSKRVTNCIDVLFLRGTSATATATAIK